MGGDNLSLRGVFNPALYHGGSKRRDFFEGWYFKFVNAQKTRSCAFIPGVSLGKRDEEPHAFVQFLSGKESRADNFTFSYDQFKYDKKVFSISVGKNSFSLDRVTLALESGENEIRGELEIIDPFLWPRKILSPGIMGPFTFVPFMECYHGVVSMDHNLRGSIAVNGDNWDFSGGRGYIEKDWGKSFPKAWIWMQSNNFDEPKVSVMLSIATIPWLKGAFTGFLCGLLLKDRLYRFTTYTGAKLAGIDVSREKVDIQIMMKELLLKISAHRTDGAGLLSPVMGSMKGRIDETLTSEIHITLLEGSKKIFEGTGSDAGLEVVGELKI